LNDRITNIESIREKADRNPWVYTLVVLIIWVTTLFGGELLYAGFSSSLEELNSSEIRIPLIVATLFLLIVVTIFGWWSQVGIKRPDNWGDLRLLWLPILLLILMWKLAESTGFMVGRVWWVVLVNTLMVGISEELMFTGILIFGASSRFEWQRAVWISVSCFGLMHWFSSLILGNLGVAIFQALMAIFFGVWSIALRLRLNTILPLMVLHWLWDFGVVSLNTRGDVATILGVGLPILGTLILFFYGLWLLEDYKGVGFGASDYKSIEV
jgi:membrane protease YdiL (CAAX protease family)